MAAPAFDRRRVNGPEVSFPPVYEDEPVASTSASRIQTLQEVAESYRRQGRTKDDSRPICASAFAHCCLRSRS